MLINHNAWYDLNKAQQTNCKDGIDCDQAVFLHEKNVQSDSVWQGLKTVILEALNWRDNEN